MPGSWARVAVAFVYAGLPGEPAFGPPAFMHRPAAMMSPEAPITHHWLDSTHITFGVAHGRLGAGALETRSLAVHGARAGRGPLRHRAAAHGQHGAARELESGRRTGRCRRPGPTSKVPNSSSPKWTRNDCLQACSTGAIWATAVHGRRHSPGVTRIRTRGRRRTRWRSRRRTRRRRTGSFSRAPNGSRRTSSARTITTSTKSRSSQSGARREFELTERLRLGLGALYTVNDVDAALAPSYGGAHPNGAMVFVQFLA